MKQIPRLLAITDLSGHSSTSLQAVISLAAALGVKVTALPTAVLSSNTEQPNFRIADLSDYLQDFLNQWKELNLKFDAILSGFLSSERQTSAVQQAISDFHSPQTLTVIDPVMADQGELYPCFEQNIVTSLRSLLKDADLITPNLTEAAFLLNLSYDSKPSLKQVKTWCRELAKLGPKKVVITDVPVLNKPKLTSVLAYDSANDVFHRTLCRYLTVNFPGTGDIFTCVLTCLLLQGKEFFSAIDQTVLFINSAMRLTIKMGTPAAEGICLPAALKFLPPV
ncbi:MAG TPA: pyridoxamine kinase [Candidatus Cloacimonadota bacterium]|nr:pyridoxamine kinase [Candidatus Cloacimonadota bacterium]HQL15456.1 pyridoxamine kinase [Candidatus Cloacimonadota bacterium]